MGLREQLLAASGRAGSSLASLPREPARPWAVLACLDARMHVEDLLGFALGDAHVLRNAGAVVTDDVLRSLAISSHLLGTREFAVIAHTTCGLLGLDEEAARRTIDTHAARPQRAPRLHAFSDLEGHVREQVVRITTCPFLPTGAQVSGWIFDMPTGELREIATGEVAATA
ncbi:MAG TPA: carbonic anhydrase [Candidatus Limnocylindria bacterium]